MALAGFENLQAGSIRVGDRDITYLIPEKRELGMVFQSYALFPHMTIFDNVAFALKTRRLPAAEIRERVHSALQMVRLGELTARKPGQLSGGQQQRVAIARALVNKPSVLLADEPLGALDKKLRQHLQLEIKLLQQELGITVIYVTHDQSEALIMADRIAVMHNGRIVQLGSPREIYETPASPFVADFIGETNFLDGRLERREEGDFLEIDGEPLIRIAPDAPRSPSAAVGAEATLAIRPERIGLFAAGALPSHPDTTVCDGTVERKIYCGDTTLYFIRLDHVDDAPVMARVPNGMAQAEWNAGDAVHAVWSQGAAILFGPSDER